MLQIYDINNGNLSQAHQTLWRRRDGKERDNVFPDDFLDGGSPAQRHHDQGGKNRRRRPIDRQDRPGCAGCICCNCSEYPNFDHGLVSRRDVRHTRSRQRLKQATTKNVPPVSEWRQALTRTCACLWLDRRALPSSSREAPAAEIMRREAPNSGRMTACCHDHQL